MRIRDVVDADGGISALALLGPVCSTQRSTDRFPLVLLLSDEVVRSWYLKNLEVASEKGPFSLPNVTERERKLYSMKMLFYEVKRSTLINSEP